MLSISPIELNGMVARTQDIQAIKHNDDAKVLVDQGNSQQQVEKNVDMGSNSVVQSQKSETNGEGSGSGGYAGDGGRHRKKKDEVPAEGKMIVKGRGGFDVSI